MNMVVAAPIPSARMTADARVKAGSRARVRKPYRRSDMIDVVYSTKNYRTDVVPGEGRAEQNAPTRLERHRAGAALA